jgi:RNA polymerase sigma-70 factor (ECF subfamily)
MGWQHRRRSEDSPPERLEPSDDDLVDLARSDPAAFALLYRRYAVAVYRYCDRALSDRGAAEEVMQSVFLRALAALPTYRGGPFRSWLFAIAHNAVVDARAARRPAATLDEAAELPDGRVSPEEEALAAVQQREIAQLLGHLPPDQRAAVVLRLAGLSDREIARALGRSPGAIRTAQYRAVQRLRGLLIAETQTETEVAYVAR